jgi:hypothetical protein
VNPAAGVSSKPLRGILKALLVRSWTTPIKDPEGLGIAKVADGITLAVVGISAALLGSFEYTQAPHYPVWFLHWALFEPQSAGWYAAIAILGTLTLAIFYKAWKYYSGAPNQGSKDGIFKTEILQANALEVIIDAVIAALGGLLISLAIFVLPVAWFVCFAVYSFFVLLRSVVTLIRPRLARHHYRNEIDTDVLQRVWIDSVTRGVYPPRRPGDTKPPIEIRYIFSGWVVSHAIWAGYGAAAAAVLWFVRIPELWSIATLYVLLVVLIAGQFGLSETSTRWGMKLCHSDSWNSRFGLETSDSVATIAFQEGIG